MSRVIGVLAHVDAGKTTFSEQTLFHAGVIRAAGRVDHKDAFLDAHPLERQRGITIFSDQAVFERGGQTIFWVDTPGHADFTAEAERALSVLDYAVLIVSAAEGVQSHTETLWRLLEAYRVPTFVFLNKIDRAGSDTVRVIADLKKRLSADIIDMDEDTTEAVAERDEALLERFLADKYDAALWKKALRREITDRAIFPLMKGAALQDAGVTEFLDALCDLTEDRFSDTASPFAARVYKVRHDEQGGRIVFFKVLSGAVTPKMEIDTALGKIKLNDLRLYNGAKYRIIDRAEAGMLCAAAGLAGVKPGDGLGTLAGDANAFKSEPMLAAGAEWNKAIPNGKVLAAFRQLEEEDPALSVLYNETTGTIELRVMGAIQLEVLKQLMKDRFGIEVDFGPMRVLYMETIAAPAYGIGHYEPLRHYAEVHLRLVPAPRGSGIHFVSRCHVDTLALNWQRLIETHVFEKTHKGVLTGAPLTDVTVELITGRDHLKHTEGGDFRESTYRAIRNALMQAESLLLEPICRFTISAPSEAYGRVMGDLNAMRAECDPPVTEGERFTLSGEAAFAQFSRYITDFTAVTHGRGTIAYRLSRYAPCRDQNDIVAASGYNPRADDSPDSVFCAHGAGFLVPWNEVRSYAHCGNL